jgi:hypothetical protein
MAAAISQATTAHFAVSFESERVVRENWDGKSAP